MNTELHASLASAADRENLLSLWNEHILRQRFMNSWEEMLSHVFNERNLSIYENCAVIRVEGIVAAGCLVPMTLQLAGTPVDTGVLTGIVTKPDYRRQGLMTKINERLILLMQERGIPLSILWGYRDRYQKFGFEICGKRNRYFIPARKLPALEADEMIKIRNFSAEKDSYLVERIARVENLSVKGTPKSYLDLFSRGNVRTLIYEDPDKPALVASNAEIANGSKQLDIFYIAGHFENVKKILSLLMTGSGFSECVITGRPDLKEEDEAFYDFYEWVHSEHICNVRINDFEALMKKVGPAIQPAIEEQGCKIQLKMRRGNRVQIWSGIPKNTKHEFSIELSDIQMVRLLFGPERPWELPFTGENARALGSVFPLFFYISPFEGA